MKKVLIALLALAVAGGLFAQSLSFSGDISTGLFFHFGDSFDDPMVELDNDDDAAAKIEFGIGYDAGNWGASIGMSAVKGNYKDDYGNVVDPKDEPLHFYDAHGWIRFIDIIKVSAGLIDPGVWNTGGWVDRNLSSGGGVRVEVEPIDGLNLGAKFGFATPWGPDTIQDFFQETAFGFSFDGGAFELSAAAKLYSEATTGGDMDMEATAGFGFYGLDIVSIYLGAAFEDLLGDADVTTLIGLNLDFDLGALGAGLEVGLTMVDGLQEAYVCPSVSFGVNNNITVGGDIGFTFKDNDGLALAEIGPGVYLEYTLGGATFTPGFGATIMTADFGDSTDLYLKFIFGFSF